MQMLSPRSKFEQSISKATNSKARPPKRKHVRNIVLETWNENGAALVTHELFKRPIDSNEIVCWKSLISVHQILHEGHPRVLQDFYEKAEYFENLRAGYAQHSGKDLFELDAFYLAFMVEKLRYHNVHPEFPGDFSLEKFMEKNLSVDPDKSLHAVTHMLDLQQAVYKLQRAIFGAGLVDEMRAAALIPLVVESYNLYTLETNLIRRLMEVVDDMDMLSFLIEKFYAQYLSLREFYFDAGNIKYVTSIIAVPSLPEDPPVFTMRGGNERERGKEKERKTERAKKVEQPVVQQPVQQPVVQQPPVQNNPFAIDSNPFAQTKHNPFATNTGFVAPVVHKQDSWVTFPTAAIPQQQPLPQPVMAQPIVPPLNLQQPKPAPQPAKPAGDFSDLVSMVKSMQPTAEQERKKREEDRRKEDEIRRKAQEEERQRQEEMRIQELAKIKLQAEQRMKEQERKRRQEEEDRRRKEEEEKREAERQAKLKEQKLKDEQRLREEQDRIKKIVQEETSKELAALKVRIAELEYALEREKDLNAALTAENTALKQRVLQLEKELREEREKNNREHQEQIESQEMQLQQMNVQYQGVIHERDQIRAEFQRLIEEQLEENHRAIMKEIDNCFNSLSLSLSRLDSPTNLGNEAATPELVARDTATVDQVTGELSRACAGTSKEALVSSLTGIMRSSVQLLDDTKGLSRKFEDSEGRQQLLNSARATGAALERLLSLVKSIGGLTQDPQDLTALNEQALTVKNNLTNLNNAAQKWKEAPEPEGGDDLEDLAERELLAAARAIEEAAKKLMATKEKQVPSTDGSLNVADAILEAAMAITKATSMLVTAAAAAQKERKGGRDTNKMYRKDPTWAQGLISAAKAVAAATSQLIETANKAVNGEIEGEAVIAASKAVAASTAQIIAACRAKAEDPNSPAQQKLNLAARAITTATQQLVAAARAASEKAQEIALLDTTGNDIHRKVKEMEIQTDILKLEKELDIARTKLFQLRKQQYKS